MELHGSCKKKTSLWNYLNFWLIWSVIVSCSCSDLNVNRYHAELQCFLFFSLITPLINRSVILSVLVSGTHDPLPLCRPNCHPAPSWPATHRYCWQSSSYIWTSVIKLLLLSNSSSNLANVWHVCLQKNCQIKKQTTEWNENKIVVG